MTTFTPPPVVGINGLNKAVAYCIDSLAGGQKGWVWIEPTHRYGAFGNPIALTWCYLDGSSMTGNQNAFEPNENRKLGPILMDLQNYAGGATSDPISGENYETIGISCFETSQAFLTLGSPVFCNHILDGKDIAILGWPTPFGNQNKKGPCGTSPAGWCFTESGGAPLPTLPSGQSYAVLSAACYTANASLNPALPEWTFNPSQFTQYNGQPDESMYQAMNRLVRNDFTTANNIMNGVAAAWDGNGFTSSHRGQYLGMFAAVVEIMKPFGFLSSSVLQLQSEVETGMWTLWQVCGGKLPGSYQTLNSANGASNFDNETNIALTYKYAPSWHERIQNAVRNHYYDLSYVATNTLATINTNPTPDGSVLGSTSTCPPGEVQQAPDGSCPSGYQPDASNPGCCKPITPPPPPPQPVNLGGTVIIGGGIAAAIAIVAGWKLLR